MRHVALLSTLALLAASWCGAAPVADAFKPVDAATRTAFARQRISGMGLSIWDAHGNKVFEQMYGDFSPDRRIPIASASKLVAGLTILRLVDQGRLSLKSTTGQVLGWTDPQGAITLEQLLSFTSGMPPRDACTLRPEITLAECVSSLSKLKLVAAPGTRFDYGNTHLHVAARMAEVVTGKSWDALFGEQLRVPLAIDADAKFYTWPRQLKGTTNPLIAAGLQMTMNEYARVLELQFYRGVFRGQRLIGDALFTAQATEPYPDAVIGDTPVSRIDLNYHYGLAVWLECAPPAVNCPVQSSPGAFGFTPWVDRASVEGTGDYYAILGMDLGGKRTGVVRFSVELAQKLRPLIREALRR